MLELLELVERECKDSDRKRLPILGALNKPLLLVLASLGGPSEASSSSSEERLIAPESTNPGGLVDFECRVETILLDASDPDRDDLAFKDFLNSDKDDAPFFRLISRASGT